VSSYSWEEIGPVGAIFGSSGKGGAIPCWWLAGSIGVSSETSGIASETELWPNNLLV